MNVQPVVKANQRGLSPEGVRSISAAVFCVVVAGALFLGWWLLKPGKPNGDPIAGMVRTACESALRAGSLNGDRVEIPRPKLYLQDRRYTLEWPAGHGLKMPNGAGGSVAVYAVCFYDGTTGKVTGLEVNGKPFP